jgi:hypothetical protein
MSDFQATTSQVENLPRYFARTTSAEPVSLPVR